MIGTTLAHFRILAKLGEGGMGVVYRAEDDKLRRPVALKVLPPDLVGNEERRLRFLREARAAAAVTHPNIATIYEVGEAPDASGRGPGVVFIAMELVEGKTLRDLIGGRALPMKDALRIALEISEGLGRAHQAGVIHRDLKPDNVIVGADRHVKILDFGLAKLLEVGSGAGADGESAAGAAGGADVGASRLRTISDEMTREGKVFGTVAYMSPEQGKGEPVDARSDIFSLGVTMYEMTTGRAPFQGKTSLETLTAIIRDRARPTSELNPEVPAELERIIGKCLEKDREDRYHHTDDLVVDLRRLKRTTDSGVQAVRGAGAWRSAPASRLERSSWLGRAFGFDRPLWMVAAMAAGAAAVLAILFGLNIGGWRDRFALPSIDRSGTPPLHLTFTRLTSDPGVEKHPSLSPDGKQIAYSSHAGGRDHLFLLRVGGRNPIDLTPDSPAGDTQPAFSPDGARIAFRSERDGGGIFLMGATGESVTRLADNGYNPAWSPDGTKIACAMEGSEWPYERGTQSEIWVVEVTTGSKTRITEGDAVQPSWSPSGRRIAYWATEGGQRDIWTIEADGGAPVRVTDDAAVDWSPVWAPDGEYLYFSSDRGGSLNLWRVPIDEATGKTLGPPQPCTVPAPSAGPVSLARQSGQIAYVAFDFTTNIHSLAFDPVRGVVTGQPVAVTHGTGFVRTPAVSPDGAWLSFQGRTPGGQEDLFIVRRDGTGLRQLTDDPHKDRGPRWSPDGKRISFFSNRTGRWEIWTISPSGGELRQLSDAPGEGLATHVWSPDGTRMVGYLWGERETLIFDPNVSWDQQVPRTLPHVGAPTETFAPWSWSPDGSLLLGEWTSSAGTGNGITTYSLASGQYTRLTDSGYSPIWLNDSRRILYLDRGKIYLVDALTRRGSELFDLHADNQVGDLFPAPDNKSICFVMGVMESDLWLATLE